MEYDLHHGGEIAFTLGIHGLALSSKDADSGDLSTAHLLFVKEELFVETEE